MSEIKMRITNASICVFQSANICVNPSFSFSQINADLFSAPLCVNYFSDFFLSQIYADSFPLITLILCAPLRFQSAPICVNYFSEFPPRHPNIPHNNSPLKIRGVPPKAGRCYDVRNKNENYECEYLRELFF